MKQSHEVIADLIGISEAATQINRSRHSIYSWVKTGALVPHYDEDGKHYRVRKSDVMDLHAARPAKGAKPGNDPAPEKPENGEPKPVRHDQGGTATAVEDAPPASVRPASAVEEVLLARVKFHTETQVREKIDPETVKRYAEQMREGDRFQPVVLFSDGKANGDLFVGDGWHRLKAARQIGYQHFPAEVRPGGLEAAADYALSANATHGKPRTHQDIRRAVRMAVKRHPDLSNRKIAELCAVDDKTVAAHRDRCGISAPAKHTGADGKSYPATRPAKKKKATQAESRYRRIKKAVRKLAPEFQKRLHALLGEILSEPAEDS